MATYYIKNGGNDAADGLTDATAWETITKVNSVQASLVAGDIISFKRGSTWTGVMLTIGKSGLAGSPITYNAYGTGNKPVISGFQTLSSWTNNGDGRYWATVTGAAEQTNMVTVDGVNTAMGRYPKTGLYLITDGSTGGNQITDNDTLSTTEDWTGADIVINKDYYILERNVITSHVNALFTFSVYGPTQYSFTRANSKFWIQNDLRCVGEGNEWYHDYAAGRLYMWDNPSAKEVKIAITKYVITTVVNYDYITFDGLTIEGSIRALVNIGDELNQYGNNNNIEIRNCTLQYGGLQGIAARMNNVAQAACIIEDNIIRYTNMDGIYAFGNGFTIKGNDISRVGVIPGVAFRGTDMQGIRCAAGANSGDFTIEDNKISYISYNGIGVYFDSKLYCQHNTIYYAMQFMDDGGGIYVAGGGTQNRTVEHNIFLYTGFGNPNSPRIARGIYMDSGADTAIIHHNIVAYNHGGSGIILHSGDNNIITDNISFDSGYSSIASECAGFQFLKAAAETSTGNTLTGNQFVALKATQYSMSSSFSDVEIQGHGTFDNNYYCRPINEPDSIYYGAADHDLADWQALTSQDANTNISPVTVTSEDEIHFLYNATYIYVMYSVSAPMTDIEGNNYTGEFSLAPWSGMILLGAGEILELSGNIYSEITLINTPACYNPADPSIISRWIATECPINFTLLRRDYYVISCADSGGFLAINIYGTFAGNDNDVISVYDLTTNSMYAGTIIDSSGDPVLITDIPYVAGMDIKYLNDHTLHAGYYFEGRLTINGVVETLTVIASPDSFGYADLDVSGILRIKTSIGKVTNYLSLIQKDTNKSGQFTLEYRGCWYGSDEPWISEGSATSPVEDIIWYYAECVRSEEQGCNLAEYVPSDLNDAPFLNQFDTPVYWYGLPFDLSFILPERSELSPTSDITVTMKVYNSNNIQVGGDITQTIPADQLEGYVNSLNVDSTLIPSGVSYFTVEITAV